MADRSRVPRTTATRARWCASSSHPAPTATPRRPAGRRREADEGRGRRVWRSRRDAAPQPPLTRARRSTSRATTARRRSRRTARRAATSTSSSSAHAGAKVDRFDGNGMTRCGWRAAAARWRWRSCSSRRARARRRRCTGGARSTSRSAREPAPRRAPLALRRQEERPRRHRGGGGGRRAAEASPSAGPRRRAARHTPLAQAAGAVQRRRRHPRRARAAAATNKRAVRRPALARAIPRRDRGASLPPTRLRPPRGDCEELRDALQENVRGELAYEVRLHGDARSAVRRPPPALPLPAFPPPPRPSSPPAALSAPPSSAPARPEPSRAGRRRLGARRPPRRGGGGVSTGVPRRQPAVQGNDLPETSPFFVCALALGKGAHPAPRAPRAAPHPRRLPPQTATGSSAGRSAKVCAVGRALGRPGSPSDTAGHQAPVTERARRRDRGGRNLIGRRRAPPSRLVHSLESGARPSTPSSTAHAPAPLLSSTSQRTMPVPPREPRLMRCHLYAGQREQAGLRAVPPDDPPVVARRRHRRCRRRRRPRRRRRSPRRSVSCGRAGSTRR